MRIVAIGLGGAGCRIVDSLYAIDRKSSRVACVQCLAVDVDETTLQQLSAMPDSLKLFFPPFDPANPNGIGDSTPTATIDIAEIISRIHNFESGENDAILICCGLGGQMTDIVPHIITGLRSSITEPIFGLVTLPCLAEGSRHSAKAADDIDILSPLLDGMIVFDNETWYKKTRTHARALQEKKDKGLAQLLGFGKAAPGISPVMATYLLLNEAIVRRISLILKAGEFRADGGIDLAEVVLDSGEVLNTLKGGGFITIGYAVEHLPSNPLAFLSQLKPSGAFNEESKKKASRIVELAKQAIYQEVSTPCDMTSAHKALILIAGPSHELSMQGFMTVRKWIDRSIRGLETRSGDYPVMNTKNVAIIIMLSGLENIPRINELREIREQMRLGFVRGTVSDDEGIYHPRLQQDTSLLKDEMIVLPSKMQKETDRPRHPENDMPRHATTPVNAPAPRTVHPEPSPVRHAQQPVPVSEPPIQYPAQHPHHQTALRKTQDTETKTERRHEPSSAPPYQQPGSPKPVQEAAPPMPGATPSKGVTGTQSKEIARLRIEQELQRQRMITLSGSQTKTGGSQKASTHPTPSELNRPKRTVISQDTPVKPAPPDHKPSEVLPQPEAKKTVIIRKRTHSPETHGPGGESPRSAEQTPENSQGSQKTGRQPVSNKEPVYRAKDEVFLGRGVRDSVVPKARDSTLIHTSLKPKKNTDSMEPDGTKKDAHETEDIPEQPGKKTKNQDELSWI